MVTTGIAGVWFITTVVLAGKEVQPFNDTVTIYTPLAAVVIFDIIGFCCELVNPFGPFHEYVPPDVLLAIKFNVPPLQTGLLLCATGVAGPAGLVIVKGPDKIFDAHPFNVVTLVFV